MGNSMPNFSLLGIWQKSHAHPKLLSCACVNLPHKLKLQYKSPTGIEVVIPGWGADHDAHVQSAATSAAGSYPLQ